MSMSTLKFGNRQSTWGSATFQSKKGDKYELPSLPRLLFRSGSLLESAGAPELTGTLESAELHSLSCNAYLQTVYTLRSFEFGERQGYCKKCSQLLFYPHQFAKLFSRESSCTGVTCGMNQFWWVKDLKHCRRRIAFTRLAWTQLSLETETNKCVKLGYMRPLWYRRIVWARASLRRNMRFWIGLKSLLS